MVATHAHGDSTLTHNHGRPHLGDFHAATQLQKMTHSPRVATSKKTSHNSPMATLTTHTSPLHALMTSIPSHTTYMQLKAFTATTQLTPTTQLTHSHCTLSTCNPHAPTTSIVTAPPSQLTHHTHPISHTTTKLISSFN